MGDVNLEIKLSNLDERVIKIEETGGGSGGDGYITSVSNDFNVINKKLSLSNNVTTKLSKVDTTDNLSVELAKKIDKPASATNGQVLTYNGTSGVWEAQNSKGGGADTSIISDAYDNEKQYVKGNYCIYDNALWKALGNSQGTAPTEGTLWTKVSVSEELDEVSSSLSGLPIIDSGRGLLKDLPANSDKSYHVIFSKQFTSPPIVVASTSNIDSNTGAWVYSLISVTQITNTGCTINVHNNENNKKSVYVNWIAVGN